MAGKPVVRSGITIVRIVNGKIVEQWEVSDTLGPVHDGRVRGT
jgi:hypothetical protein